MTEEVKIEEILSEKTKNRIKNWLKNKYNFYFLGILIFAIAIRLYYFFMTLNQPLWWDESEYMAFAKNIAFGVPYDISPQRVVLFPFLASLILKLGLGEIGVRFLLVLVPSVLIVVFTYYFVKSMYNEKIALITTFLTSVLWIHLFYTMRVMNDELSFLFGLLALFLFWQGYIVKKKNLFVYLSAFFIALSFLLRPAGIYYAFILIIFLFLTENFRFLLKKELWIMPLAFILVLVPHLIWSYFYHGNALAFRGAFGGPASESFGWNILNFVPAYTEWVLLGFFVIGLFTLTPMFLTFDKTLRGDKKYQNDLLMLILVLFILGISIFLIRQVEDRWLMAMSLGILVFISKGILFVSDFIKKYFGMKLSITVIIIILILGGVVHLSHSDNLIKVKLDSYSQIRDAGLWIKSNSYKEDVVFSRSKPQITYYSERKTISFPQFETTEKNETDLINLLKDNKAKYFIISIFEIHPEWMLKIPEKYPQVFVPVQAYEMNGQPVLVIYQVDYTKF